MSVVTPIADKRGRKWIPLSAKSRHLDLCFRGSPTPAARASHATAKAVPRPPLWQGDARAVGTSAICNCWRRFVELLNRKAGGGPIVRHERPALLRRDNVVDIVECTPAALIDHVEQPKRPGAAIAQDKLRNRPAQLTVVSGKRLLRSAVLDHRTSQN